MTGRAKRFLAPETLDEAVRELAVLAHANHVSIALIGGYALQLYGSSRLTGDVDVVADALIRGLPTGKPLSFGGVQTAAPNGVPVDLVLRDDDYRALYDEALENAVELDTPLRVVRLEYIVAMKMVAGRARDEADLEWIILESDIGRGRLSAARSIIHRHLGPYAVREFDRLVDQVEWQASRSR
jgi:hypothetical protein